MSNREEVKAGMFVVDDYIDRIQFKGDRALKIMESFGRKDRRFLTEIEAYKFLVIRAVDNLAIAKKRVRKAEDRLRKCERKLVALKAIEEER